MLVILLFKLCAGSIQLLIYRIITTKSTAIEGSHANASVLCMSTDLGSCFQISHEDMSSAQTIKNVIDHHYQRKNRTVTQHEQPHACKQSNKQLFDGQV